jgi:uncharacterized Zn finger protein (UPF0148 family)
MSGWIVTRVMLADDRGRQVPLWRYRGAAKSDDEVQRGIALRAAQIHANEYQRMAALLGLLAPLLLIGLFAAGLPSYLLVAPIILLLLVTVHLYGKRVARMITPSVRITLLSEGCCASCAYDLAGIPPEADGCTVCPECDAAWRIEPEMLEARAARERLHPPPKPCADEVSSDLEDRQRLRRALMSLGLRRVYAARDAKGRMVELANGMFFAKPPARWCEVAPELRPRLRRGLWLVGWPWRLVGLLCFLPLYLFMGWNSFYRFGPGGLAAAPLHLVLGFIFQGLLFPLFIIAFILAPFTRSGRPIIRLMMRRGHCPSCAAGLPPLAADGTVVCSACRAVWQADGPAQPWWNRPVGGP